MKSLFCSIMVKKDGGKWREYIEFLFEKSFSCRLRLYKKNTRVDNPIFERLLFISGLEVIHYITPSQPDIALNSVKDAEKCVTIFKSIYPDVFKGCIFDMSEVEDYFEGR